MKIIASKVSAAVALILILSISAHAYEQYGYNEIMASQYARWIAQIKSQDDVTEFLPMSEKDKGLVKAEVKKSKVSFENLKVSMIQPTKLEIISSSGDKIYISFRQFNKSYLYINDKALKLEPHKTFYNYQAEVDVILSQSEKSARLNFGLIESAYAQSKNTLKNFTASIGVSNGYVLFRGGLQKDVAVEPTPDNLEKVLIQAFKNESDRAKKIDRQNGRDPFFTALTFTCVGNKLQTVQEKMLVYKGAPANRGSTKLERIDDTTFRYTDLVCDVKISKSGKLLSKNLGECGISADFFSGPPFFAFPLVASQCCKKKGCAAAVKAATDKVTATHIKRGKSSK
jgi:hypothetical protein